MILLNLVQLHVVRFSSLVQVFQPAFLVFAKLKLRMRPLLLHIDLLSTHVGALDSSPAIISCLGCVDEIGDDCLFAGDDDAVALLLEGKSNAGLAYMLSELYLEI